jgi:methylmalonyl-CoA mutase
MTDPADDILPLAAEFPPSSQAEWRKLVEAALKGADFDKRLVSQTYDGLRMQPLYPRAAKAQPVVGRPASPWQVLQRIDHPDPAAANAEARHELENGANGLTLVFAGSLIANGYGLDGSAETLDRVLDGIYLDAGVSIDFNLGPQSRTVARHFAALVKRRKLAPTAITMRASINPLGGFAAAAHSPQPWSKTATAFAALVGELAGHGFSGPFAVADGRIIHNAGGSEAQELAFALACATAYLRALEAGGIALEAGRRLIYFRLAADADQFLTIAKFRALRKLWARVEQACGLKPLPVFVSAETAWRMMTKRDPYVNILRTTIAVAAAGIGGADAIGALPFTAALGLPDRFARRLARNTQLILLEESNLAKVADPSAGAGGIEELTSQLCTAAWSLFQEIERAGGAEAALEQGLIQNKVAVVRAARQAAVARRKDALTGTSDYPNLGEAAVAVLAVPPVVPPDGAAPATIEPLPRIRLAEPFERLRDASDRLRAKTGSRPKIFLANLGELSTFTARAMFANNFFAAGGIEPVSNDGFKSREQMLAAFKASGARLACLCGSDAVYANEAAAAAKALAAAGALVYLAGRPGAQEAAWRQAGVKSFIFTGCDVLATLQAAHDSLRLK